MKIIAQAPCRLSLVGGGTDVDPFACQHGGQVLNLAISLYHTATLISRPDNQIILHALNHTQKTSLSKLPFTYYQSPKFALLYAIINHFRLKTPSGFSLTVTGPAIQPLGLGRSGSVAVSVIGAFNAWLKLKLNQTQIGLLASDLEIKELNWPNGKQDGLVSAFGGINLMSFGPGQKITVTPIFLSKKIITGFKKHLMLIFIGGEHHSGSQQKALIQGMSKASKLAALCSLKENVFPALKAFKQSDWRELGKILSAGWQNKKNSNPHVSNQKIDKLYQIAITNGAYGGKLAGSGGGGYLFFLCPPAKQSAVINNLAKFNVQAVGCDLDFKGLQVQIC